MSEATKELTATGDTFSLFSQKLTEGVEALYAACRIYVEAIDLDPDMKKKFQDAFADTIPSSAWSSFEAVGRKQVHHLLLFGGGKNAQFIKKLPYSGQEKILSGEMVEMLTSDGDMLPVDVRDLSKDQAVQVIGAGYIRDLPQQKAFLEKKKAEAANTVDRTDARRVPYTISKGKVFFNENTMLTYAEVRRIALELS